MDNRERMTRFIKGLHTDRVPFVQYDNISAPNKEIWDLVGRETMGISIWTKAYSWVSEKCTITSEAIIREGRKGFRETLHTPSGRLYQERFPVPSMPGVTNIGKYYISTPADYDILMTYLADIRIIENRKELIQNWEYVGRDGLPHIWIGRTPYQELWVNWVSFEKLSLHMYDCRQKVEDIMNVLGDMTIKAADITAKISDDISVPYIVLGDNITAPLIGKENFTKYCVPYYRQISEILNGRDIPLISHMDGDLKPLWPLIGDSGLRGIDSMSPPPDNDTSVSDALSLWPEMLLLINFPSSVHLLDEQSIYRHTCSILDEAGNSGRLQIQISENTPPGCWKKSYPQIIRAIRDFS